VNALELKGEMARRGVTSYQMADVIGKTRTSFDNKKAGRTPFHMSEIVAVAKALSLSPEMVKVIFFDDDLQNGKLLADIVSLGIAEEN
jgi:hypothetical protein